MKNSRSAFFIALQLKGTLPLTAGAGRFAGHSPGFRLRDLGGEKNWLVPIEAPPCSKTYGAKP